MICPNVFIDTSYVVYYTGYSTYTWYLYEFNPTINEDGSFDPMVDPEYKAEYDKRFQYNVMNVASQNTNMLDRKRIYFCLDCRRDKIWRMSYFPEYKIMRKTQKKIFSWNSIFNYTHDVLIPNMCEKHGCKVIKDNNSTTHRSSGHPVFSPNLSTSPPYPYLQSHIGGGAFLVSGVTLIISYEQCCRCIMCSDFLMLSLSFMNIKPPKIEDNNPIHADARSSRR